MDGSGRDVISLAGSGRDYVLLDYDRAPDQVTEFSESDVIFLKNFDAYTGVQRGADFHLRANGVTEVVLSDVTTTWAELLDNGQVESGEAFLEAVAALADLQPNDEPPTKKRQTGENPSQNSDDDNGAGRVAGRLFVDADGDGSYDEGQDTGISDRTVVLLRNGREVATTETGASGYYKFDDVPVGEDYSVRFFGAEDGTDFVARDGQHIGVAGNLNSPVFAVTQGETSWEAGHVLPKEKETGKVSGLVYAGADDEIAMAGLEVALMRDGAEVARTTTGPDGFYTFGDIAAGEGYSVRIFSGEAEVKFKPNSGESVGIAGNLNSAEFTVRGGNTVWMRSEAEMLTGKVAGRLYVEEDGRFGYDDAEDWAVSGYQVSLIKDGEVIATTTTNDEGYFEFDNVVTGDGYSLRYMSETGGMSFLTEPGQWVGGAGNLNSEKFDVAEGQTTWQRGAMERPGRLELGTADIKTSERGDWTRIDFEHGTIIDPIVVVGPLSGNGSDEASIRVRNVDETGFELHVSEWDGLDGFHVAESISWMAASRGLHTLPDGSVVEAGRTTLENETSKEVQFGREFEEPPLLFSSLSTTNGAQPVTTRMSDVSVRKFEVAMREAEASDGHHIAETLDWIAILDNGDLFKSGQATTNDQWTNLGIDHNHTDADVFLASLLTDNGPDTATLRYDRVADGSIRVRIDEEKTLDEEKFHVNEDMNFFFADVGSYLLEA